MANPGRNDYRINYDCCLNTKQMLIMIKNKIKRSLELPIKITLDFNHNTITGLIMNIDKLKVQNQ